MLLAGAARAFGAPADAGVLILGESGRGKSDLALRLIERGAALVADDRVELFVQEDRLWARPPARLAGLIEIRGLGILRMPHAADAAIALAVRLVDTGIASRLPEPQTYRPPATLPLFTQAKPPLVELCGFESSAPAKVLAAAAGFAHTRFCDEHNPP